jgi:HD-GYP domain-containing protein (c-di-GMP phosphodiesterase class II)
MRLSATSRVAEGAVLARDVSAGRSDGIPLLRAGVVLNDGYREALLRAGINAVYIEDDASAGILPKPIISDETRAVATRAMAAAHDGARRALDTGRPLEPRTLDALAEVVARILREIESSAEVALALADLSSADAYTFQHSIDVTAVGLLLGQRLFRERGWVDYRGTRRFSRIDERLSRLGMGLLLHDIGKLAVPTEVLNKPGKLDPEEWELMKSHPRLGVELLGPNAICPLVRAVVLRHHERWDGSGYPYGIAGENIHQMARIAAVADVYDAVTSSRVYAEAKPAHEGARLILEGSGTAFDPEVVEVFERLVAPYPPGVEITLTDGRRGIVARVGGGALHRPVVRITSGSGAPYEIHLEHEPSIQIAGWAEERPADAA